MSFAVRPTWKPRFVANMDEGNMLSMPNPEETKAIVEAIKQFKQKSAHSQIQNIAELQTVLGKSSVNPEFNPGARQGVESILRGKHDNQADTDIGQLVSGPVTSSGFSSQSVSRHNVRSQVDKLEKELAKKLEEIKQQFRQKPEPPISAKKERKEVKEARAKREEKTDSELDPEIADLIEQNEEDEENAENEENELQFENQEQPDLNHLVAPGFGPQPIRPGMSLSSVSQRNQSLTQSSQTTQPAQDKQTEKNAELAAARKLISIGYPARAAMARGYQPRVSGLGGNAIRRTALGLSDAF
jgi:hypothetical protein